MQFIQPIGRSAGGVQPRACTCFTSSSFAGARSTDSCFRCGCGCSATEEYKTGNSNNAFATIRRS